MDNLKTPEDIYKLVWKSEMENEDGSFNRENIVNTLYSYAALLNNNRILYEYITNGYVSDPRAYVSQVMQAADEYTASIVETSLQDVIQDLLDTGQKVENLSDRTEFYESAFNRFLSRGVM